MYTFLVVNRKNQLVIVHRMCYNRPNNTKTKGFDYMNTYNTTRNAKFLLNYHFVWIPKYRKGILDDQSVQVIVRETIEELSVQHKFDVLALEIEPDHVHLFISALPKDAPSQLINVIKGTTGRRIGQTHPELKRNGSIWTRSYFVASTGNVSSETIREYINKQGG